MRDRFDKDITDRFGKNEGGGSFMMGLLTGTVVGVGLGMLLAPKAGSELRNQLSDQAGALANQAREGYRKATENAAQWAAHRSPDQTIVSSRGGAGTVELADERGINMFGCWPLADRRSSTTGQ